MNAELRAPPGDTSRSLRRTNRIALGVLVVMLLCWCILFARGMQWWRDYEQTYGDREDIQVVGPSMDGRGRFSGTLALLGSSFVWQGLTLRLVSVERVEPPLDELPTLVGYVQLALTFDASWSGDGPDFRWNAYSDVQTVNADGPTLRTVGSIAVPDIGQPASRSIVFVLMPISAGECVALYSISAEGGMLGNVHTVMRWLFDIPSS